ncbi:formimidoylglutamate deiminase [Rhizosphaericola mali]|uniref:Formimidoylglutamate deiminase n=1 Tax=Rhizosphaericola mali TaxID=2545455 RepID=A0A5P2G4N1_9BACT|nr:formimidoylglutamate deiminase [Rhizosphaericola mali]QES89109.1 formimidoylglutamate deiminase [Rhizosphaericola mali]
MNKKTYFLKGILTENGWLENVAIEVDSIGEILSIQNDIVARPDYEMVNGYALPGFQNGHSHAFQYAMVGLAEYDEGHTDNFWTWRNAMYDLALTISPIQMEAIASQLYADMLRMGYTAVAEFHYVHHQPNGQFYDQIDELGQALMRAADKVGIHLTLIPILYQKGNFGKNAEAKQRRFICSDIEDYFRLLDASIHSSKSCDRVDVAVGAHSLRAVGKENLQLLLQTIDSDRPFHMHISEQIKEIEDCLDFYKQRPVEWLLDNFNVNKKFNLVHATHMTAQETKSLANTGANVVLCPATEGNLGDGIFNFTQYNQSKGSWCIGTDSHISINHLEDLRWVDNVQRLITHQRISYRIPNSPDSGFNAIKQAWQGGRRAMGKDVVQFFKVGDYFDAVIVDASEPLIASTNLKNMCNTIVYGQNSSFIKGTITAGKWRVKNGRHIQSDSIGHDFVKNIKELGSR